MTNLNLSIARKSCNRQQYAIHARTHTQYFYHAFNSLTMDTWQTNKKLGIMNHHTNYTGHINRTGMASNI